MNTLLKIVYLPVALACVLYLMPGFLWRLWKHYWKWNAVDGKVRGK